MIGAVTSLCAGGQQTAESYCLPYSYQLRGTYFNENFWPSGTASSPYSSGETTRREDGSAAVLVLNKLLETTDGAGGIRTHGLELMRLARTAAPLPRVVAKQVWPAGVEPAVSGSRNRRGGLLPYSQKSMVQYPRRDSNPQLPG